VIHPIGYHLSHQPLPCLLLYATREAQPFLTASQFQSQSLICSLSIAQLLQNMLHLPSYASGPLPHVLKLLTIHKALPYGCTGPFPSCMESFAHIQMHWALVHCNVLLPSHRAPPLIYPRAFTPICVCPSPSPPSTQGYPFTKRRDNSSYAPGLVHPYAPGLVPSYAQSASCSSAQGLSLHKRKAWAFISARPWPSYAQGPPLNTRRDILLYAQGPSSSHAQGCSSIRPRPSLSHLQGYSFIRARPFLFTRAGIFFYSRKALPFTCAGIFLYMCASFCFGSAEEALSNARVPSVTG
jgi:hypothetical protein